MWNELQIIFKYFVIMKYKCYQSIKNIMTYLYTIIIDIYYVNIISINVVYTLFTLLVTLLAFFYINK